MLLIIHWLLYNDYLYTYLHLQFWQSRWSRIHKQPPEVFFKFFANFTGRHLCWSLFFTKLEAFRPATLLKIDPYSVFLWNLRRTPILKNIWTAASVYRLLHHIFIFRISRVHVLHFYRELLLYYAFKTIELMTREAVSFQEVFHWTKFLTFES